MVDDDRPTEPGPLSIPAAAERCCACVGTGLCSAGCHGWGVLADGADCGCDAGDCAACGGVGWLSADAPLLTRRGACAEKPTLEHRIRLGEGLLAEAVAAEADIKREYEAMVESRRGIEQRLQDLYAQRDAAPPPAPCTDCGGSGVCPRCGGDGADRVTAAQVAVCGCVAGRCRACGGTGASAPEAP